MAEQAVANVDYLKLVVKPRKDGSKDYQLIGPRDVLEPIFKDDVRCSGISIYIDTCSIRYTIDSDGRRKQIENFSEECIVTVTDVNQGGTYGSWTWSAWVKVLTSNGFTCKSVAHGRDGGNESEIWLFERKNDSDVAMLEEDK